MTELAVTGIPVAVTYRVLKLSRQPYYRWLANPITASEVVEAYRANALFDAHKDDPEFGHRRVRWPLHDRQTDTRINRIDTAHPPHIEAELSGPNGPERQRSIDADSSGMS